MVHDLVALLIALASLSVAVSASRCRRLPRTYAGGVDVLDQWRRPADIWRQP